jgi:divalent metal cation (Fe/Co/Zn/Cd) transporter
MVGGTSPSNPLSKDGFDARGLCRAGGQRRDRGRVASLYHGVQHILAPEPIASPAINFAALGIAAVFEGSSLAVLFREFKRVVRGRDVALWTFILVSKDPSLYASLLEDSAALVGISIAALGALGTTVFHLRWADGAASLAIGVLLTAVAIVLANETRRLIAGEAVAPPVMAEIKRLLRGRRDRDAAPRLQGRTRGADPQFSVIDDPRRSATGNPRADRRDEAG